MSAIAYGMFVAERQDQREADEPPFGVLDRVPDLLGAADLAEEHRGGDQRADRHHQVRRADPVQLDELGDVDPGRLRRGGAQRVESLAGLLVLAEHALGAVRQCGCLQHRDHVAERVGTEAGRQSPRSPGRHRRAPPWMSSSSARSAEQPMVAGASRRRSVKSPIAGRPSTTITLRVFSVTVRDPRVVQRAHLMPQVRRADRRSRPRR